MNRKEYLVLKFFKENENQVFTSKQVATQLGMSDKTIQKYTKELIAELADKGVHFESKQGQGYRFTIKDDVLFQEYFSKQKQKFESASDVFYIDNKEDRIHFILNKLCFENEPVTQDSIENDLFISRSTARKLLIEIRQILADYQLNLNRDANLVFTIVGEERAIRHFIISYLLNNSIGSLVGEDGHTPQLIDERYSRVASIVLDEIRDNRLSVPDYVIKNLITHLILMIRRVEIGQYAPSLPEESIVEAELVMEISTNILERLSEEFNRDLPQSERKFISLHLRDFTKDTDQEQDDTIDWPRITHDISYLLDQMKKDLHLNLVIDSLLLNGLTTHIKTMLSRLENQVLLKNPMKETILDQYHEIYYATKAYLQSLPILVDYEISEDEWSYITLHILASMERAKSKSKYKVLVVCASGVGSAQMLKTRLENELGNYISIEDVISYYELNLDKFNHVDLIISTIDLQNLILPVPSVLVSVFLNATEVEEVKEALDINGVQFEVTAAGNREVLEFEKLCSPENFLVFDHVIDKDVLLSILIDEVNETGNDEFRQQFLNELSYREKFGSVVFDEAVAVPHPSTALNEQERIAIAICMEPLKWDEANNDVHFVFLIAPSKFSNKQIKIFSRRIINFVENKALQENLLNNPIYDNFKEMITNKI